MLDQGRAPILEALNSFKAARVVPFDVPGHKHGRGNPELTAFLGRACLEADVNSMKPLDNLCHPVSVIREAQELAAEAFGAKNAFFMVNGTTSAVQNMILSVCKRGDKIILPRNVHRSAINALVLSGAVPVYVNPQTHDRLSIALGMSMEDVRAAIRNNPDAKAVFVNNPTYYGVCSNLKEIVSLAHSYGMVALVDEAHGTHFYFGEGHAHKRDGRGRGYGEREHAQVRRLAHAEFAAFDRPRRQRRARRSDHQPHADYERLLPAAFKP